MFIATLAAGKSIRGFLEKGQVETGHIRERHAQLTQEMIRRGYKPKVPLRELEIPESRGSIDIEANLEDLRSRCPKCRARIDLHRERPFTTGHRMVPVPGKQKQKRQEYFRFQDGTEITAEEIGA